MYFCPAMYSDNFHIITVPVYPIKCKTFIEQINECFERISVFLKCKDLSSSHIIKQSIFCRFDGQSDHSLLTRKLDPAFNNYYKSAIPPTNIVFQNPENQAHVSMEFLLFTGNISQIENKKFEGIDYIVVHYPAYDAVIAAGITTGEKYPSVFEQAASAFELTKQLLAAEKLDFSNIVRQWNYIENISSSAQNDLNSVSNYHHFNKIRSAYYDGFNFKNGYPASTGIGVMAGGVILDILAISNTDSVSIFSLENPSQINAHQYSNDVITLIPGENILSATPKFERAKILSFDDHDLIFISGTAAIIGQDTVYDEDIEKQTLTTIDNITRLVSAPNLELFGILKNIEPGSFSNIRVYIKNEKDMEAVKKICNFHFQDVPSLFVVSDICRTNLLVEIEGNVDLIKVP